MSTMAMLSAPAQHLSNLLGPLSPFSEAGPAGMIPSPGQSPASDMTRYFSSEQEYDENSLHSAYSSPPSSVPSASAHHDASFCPPQQHYPSFSDFGRPNDTNFNFQSSPLAHLNTQAGLPQFPASFSSSHGHFSASFPDHLHPAPQMHIQQFQQPPFDPQDQQYHQTMLMVPRAPMLPLMPPHASSQMDLPPMPVSTMAMPPLPPQGFSNFSSGPLALPMEDDVFSGQAAPMPKISKMAVKQRPSINARPPFRQSHMTSDQLDRPLIQAPRAAVIPSVNLNPKLGDSRPEPKRRKTCPDLTAASIDAAAPSVPMSMSTGGSFDEKEILQQRHITDIKEMLKSEKRGAGKDGEDVWPEDAEIAFFESIRLVPKLGRKKIVVNGKPCGRNELIGDYIRRKTGRIRSRKQVSSHIQVLKNIRKSDDEFMDLLAEPKAGEVEEDFTPEAHRLFFLPQEFAHVFVEHPSLSTPCSAISSSSSAAFPFDKLSPSVKLGFPARDGLLSPYVGGPLTFGSVSSAPSSPAYSACSSANATRAPSPLPLSAMTPSEDLPTKVQSFKIKLAPPSPNYPIAAPLAYGPISGKDQADPDATPKSSPSKLGHRRIASRGLTLSIPPNAFTIPQIQVPSQEDTHNADQHVLNTIDSSLAMASASQPTTPWVQVVHTPTCAPPAPAALSSPSQRRRLPQIWAAQSSDWNKASPALEANFDAELSAVLASSKVVQQATTRYSVPLKRAHTDLGLSTAEQVQQDFMEPKEDEDLFFSNLLGSRAI